MATDVVMPQMGESVAEGTIVRWLKKVGDPIERDEPLFEISTDKVDAEIPSPVAGVVSEIRHKEGETVEINTVVAVISPAGTRPAAAPVSAPAPTPAPAAVAPPPPPPPHYHAVDEPKTTPPPHYHAVDEPKATPPPPPPHYHAVEEHYAPPPVSAPAPVAPVAPPPAPAPVRTPAVSVEDALHQRSSPLVRKIAKEHNVDIAQLSGSGISGRVTKNDILSFIGGAPAAAAPASVAPPAAPSAPVASAPVPAASKPAPKPAGVAAGAGMAGQTVPMSVMRKKIAEHMINSRRTSAHVHSVFEINFQRVDKIRQAKKAEYERQGAKLTYLSFIIKAVADALKAVPVINSSLSGDNVVYHKDVNIGIAVALDWGLIVPVIKNADQKSLLEVSRSVVDLANRARAKQLKPDEVSGGTFTITNPGVFGAIVGMPIISQPQVAIVSIGAVQKRVVVVDDAIAIRPMAFFSIGFDHRIIDGAIADEFLQHVQHALENWDANNV
jgi:2-oxoglutarate dehydrogenase E2 component (dihydrolipoamide succinyltransferase)